MVLLAESQTLLVTLQQDMTYCKVASQAILDDVSEKIRIANAPHVGDESMDSDVTRMRSRIFDGIKSLQFPFVNREQIRRITTIYR
jgi:hypothetical protein